jgi:HPt (histidine-containing phosphotransfer) domain-containing protein
MTDAALIDWTQFEMIRTECAEEIGSIFADFIAEAPSQLLVLREALAQGDAAAFGRMAHQWKGSSATFGMTAFAARLQGFEHAGKKGSLPPEADLDAAQALFAASLDALYARHPELKTA